MSENSKQPLGSKNIYLIGFMGSGKSTVGKLLAQALHREFVDLDEEIAQQAGCSIPHIFQREGEVGFRERESAALRQIAQRQNLVIALGGGAVVRDENWKLVQETGISIYLKVSPELLHQRLESQVERPLLGASPQRLQKITEILHQRQARYEQADLTICNEGTPHEAVTMIREQLREMAAIVRVALKERSYDIWVEPGILKKLGSLYRRYHLGPKAAIITDEIVAGLYSDSVCQSLRAQGVEAVLCTIPPGEDQKSLQTAERLYTRLLEAGLDRHSVIIALGGGVIGDLGGFVASTFLRGIEYIQIPTTLLAQVDSSIGGKTAVNHPLGKNLIGTFYQPRLVLIDPTVLQTLPKRELWSGLAEVIKYGLIGDPALLQRLEADLEYCVKNPTELGAIIGRCCTMKAEIVSADERESGRRSILNFGHTIGHALEAASGYELRHGEAIAWGMIAAARLSHRKTGLSTAELDRIERLLQRVPKPSLGGLRVQAVVELLRRDKKSRDGQVRFVLLQSIGKPVLCDAVSDSDVQETLQTLL